MSELAPSVSAAPDRLDAPDQIATQLAAWGRAMEAALHDGQPQRAAALARVVLRLLPRHLPTYQRLLRAAWMLRRWEEGAEWGRRLLQADPSNALAWQALAQAAEQRGRRAEAFQIWQRAFETAPYAPEIRAGLSRTSLATARPLTLNAACLATLYLRGYRWSHAAAVYRALAEADPRRIDFQIGQMVALWRLRADAEAYRLARHLAQVRPLLLLPWVVVGALGDENDRALARNPLITMDPDGEFVRSWLGLATAPQAERKVLRSLPSAPVTLAVSPAEAELLQVDLTRDS